MRLAWQQMVWCASTLAVGCSGDSTAESEAGSEQQAESSVSKGEATEQPGSESDAASEPDTSSGGLDASTGAAADPALDASPAPMTLEAGECLPGTSQCVDPLAQRLCSTSGGWGERIACVHQTCSAGVCAGVCALNEVGCKDSHTRLSCQADGAWLETACADQACVAGACAGVCSPGSKRCAGYDLQRCNDSGSWDSEACEFGCNALLLRCRPDPLCKDCAK